MINELIKLATYLDRNDLSKEADHLDAMIKRLAHQKGYNPIDDEFEWEPNRCGQNAPDWCSPEDVYGEIQRLRPYYSALKKELTELEGFWEGFGVPEESPLVQNTSAGMDDEQWQKAKEKWSKDPSQINYLRFKAVEREVSVLKEEIEALIKDLQNDRRWIKEDLENIKKKDWDLTLPDDYQEESGEQSSGPPHPYSSLPPTLGNW